MKKIVLLILFFSLEIFMFSHVWENGEPSDSPVDVMITCRRGGGISPKNSPDDPSQASDNGIGPVQKLELGPIDRRLSDRGRQLFKEKCAVCHDLDKSLTSPALGSVLKRRTPRFVLNMILNTSEMVAKNETVKRDVAQFGMPMPLQDLTTDEARAVLEYLRTTGK
jgi:cytochrome c